MSGLGAARALAELARSYGVQTSYVDAQGRRVVASQETVLGVLRALGAEVERVDDAPAELRRRRRQLGARIVEPVVVAWDGRLRGVAVRAPSGARIGVELEHGGGADVVVASGPGGASVSARGRLPTGYHTLSIETRAGRAASTVVSAPRRAPAIPPGSWAVFAPLYAVRSAADDAIGSFTLLGELDRWAAERGAGMLGTLPLFAAFLNEPFEPSPYSPASRLFWNEAFVDVGRVGELDPSAPARAERQGQASASLELVDHRAVAAAKRRRLEPLAERFFRRERPETYRRFVAATPEVRAYARFRAELDRRRAWWGAWPAGARDGRLLGAPEDDPAGRYHLYAQWLASEQLGAVGRRAKAEGRGLYLDLPLGVHRAGYDVWRHRSSFATGASAGAPPDRFFTGGQDWDLPPLHPERIRDDGYAYPRAVLANLLRCASVLRVDHVMGLHRLYWIPGGADPRGGAYVRYRADEWYALLSLEAHRAGAGVVGEDLGTVPGYVRRAMRRHRFHTSYVLQFEVDPATSELRDPAADAAACLGTHDLPTWAAFWSGDDLRLRVDLGLLGSADAEERREEREAIRGAIVGALSDRGLLPAGRSDAASVLAAALRFLAASDAALAVVALEDLWLEELPQNVPGTGAELGNWRRRLRLTLEELATDERVRRLLDAVADGRAAAAREAA